MNLTNDTNKIVARIMSTATPAAKMQCDLQVVSAMNAMNEAVEAYNMGRRAALADRRYQTATAVVNGLLAHQFIDTNEEETVIERAIRIGDKLARRLDIIEQNEFENFRKLED